MKVHNVTQGGDEWLALRAGYFTASEAPAMLGLSKYITRSDLLHQKATGFVPEVDAMTQSRFDDGHQAEDASRPWAVELVGQDLYPVTGTKVVDGMPMLASFDGLTIDDSIVWENKLWNAEFAAQVDAGIVPDTHWPQLEHQMIVSGARKTLFTVSDGHDNKTYVWYESDPYRREQVLSGWAQFAADMTAYEPAEAEPELVGTAPHTLPALRIELTGMVTASNLSEFRSTAMAVIDSVNTDLQTDEDFADAKKAVKWCSDVESKLDAAKSHALSQTSSIDELFRTLDDIKETARAKRLNLDKLVKAREKAIRDEILMGGKKAYADHIEKLNASLGGKVRLPDVPADFPGVMKNKRTITSLRDAVDTELARVKIASSQVADGMRLNLETLRTDAVGYESLFADAQQIVMKDNEDLKNLIKARIAEHKEAEEKRLDAEREKIRAEEEAKAKARAAVEQEPAPSTQPDDTQAPVSKPAPTTTGLPSKQARMYSVSVVTDEPDHIMADRIYSALSADDIQAEVRPIRGAA